MGKDVTSYVEELERKARAYDALIHPIKKILQPRKKVKK